MLGAAQEKPNFDTHDISLVEKQPRRKMKYHHRILGSWKREIIVLISTMLSIHLLMLIHDITSDFQPFLLGDRGSDRWLALLALVQAEPASYLSHMVEGKVVPGEYLFQLPPYLVAGPIGIIIFEVFLSSLSTIIVYKTSAILLPWKHAPFVCGLLYSLLPQNIVYPHQFVTEAVATPLCILFLYLQVRSLCDNRISPALWGSVCYGLAIFVRPSLVLALPALFLLPILYSSGNRLHAAARSVAICIVAFLPLAFWVAAFTSATGRIGYTSGVANLGWNLRSKVFLVYAANELAEPPELSRFSKYSELYYDPSGISVSRYLEAVSEHPLFFFKDALISLGQLFGRANITKLFVDYLGMGGGQNIKDLPKIVLGGGNARALFDAMRANADVIWIFALEAALSLVNLFFVSISVGFLLFALVRPQKVSLQIGFVAFQSMLVIASILLAVIASSEIVDAAQARLRNPVDIGVIILCGLFFFYRQGSGSDTVRIKSSGLRSAVKPDP